MPQPPPISLTILRKGDTNIVDLAEVGALIPRSETRVDGAFLREVSAEVGSIGLPRYGRDDHVAVVRDLQRLGELLFSHLLPEAARQRLADIYHWFTEGFDTADLKGAKALLAELNR